jgi:hypothetical protein
VENKNLLEDSPAIFTISQLLETSPWPKSGNPPQHPVITFVSMQWLSQSQQLALLVQVGQTESKPALLAYRHALSQSASGAGWQMNIHVQAQRWRKLTLFEGCR